MQVRHGVSHGIRNVGYDGIRKGGGDLHDSWRRKWLYGKEGLESELKGCKDLKPVQVRGKGKWEPGAI